MHIGVKSFDLFCPRGVLNIDNILELGERKNCYFLGLNFAVIVFQFGGVFIGSALYDEVGAFVIDFDVGEFYVFGEGFEDCLDLFVAVVGQKQGLLDLLAHVDWTQVHHH